ncbi:major capsid protein [Desulfurobacterium sp.]
MVELERLLQNPKIVAEVIKTLPPIQTKVLDDVYTRKVNHPFPQIGIKEVQDVAGSVPVVRRGAPGVPVSGGDASISYIEPQPIKVTDSVTAVDANNLKSMGSQGYRAFMAQKLDILRRKIKATTEALAAQSLTGKISYPIRLENGKSDTYEVDFGSPFSYPIATTWDAADLKTVFSQCVEIEAILQEEGIAQSVTFWAGKSAFMELVGKVQNLTTNAVPKPEVKGNKINLWGYEIEMVNQKYRLPDGTLKPVVPDNQIVAFDKNAGFTLFYLAIDNFKAGLQAVPMFISSYQTQDGSSFVIQAESKPLPVPIVKAICWATVL